MEMNRSPWGPHGASAGRGTHMLQYKGCILHAGACRGGNHYRD